MQVLLTRLPHRVALLTLRSPPVNAMTTSMGKDWGEAFREIQRGDDISCLVVTGEGGSFSAGGDMGFLRSRASCTLAENEKTMLDFYKLYLDPLRHCPYPVIACVHGNVVGAGACLATACDIRVVAKCARVGFTFTSGVAIHPGMGGSHFLPQVIGMQNASRLLLSGEIVSGEEMVSMGWGVGPVETPSQALPRAIAMATKIAAAAPVALYETLKTLRARGNEGLGAALEREAKAQAVCYSGPDFLHGVESVVKKEKPNWTQYASFSSLK